jgi:hypothetical protein
VNFIADEESRIEWKVVDFTSIYYDTSVSQFIHLFQMLSWQKNNQFYSGIKKPSIHQISIAKYIGCAACFRFQSETREIEEIKFSLRSEAIKVIFRLFCIEAEYKNLKENPNAKWSKMKQNKHSKTKNVKQNDEKKRKNCFSHFQTKNAKQN